MLTGRVPLRGEVISHESGVEFEVVDADPRRIKRVRLRSAETVAAGRPIKTVDPAEAKEPTGPAKEV